MSETGSRRIVARVLLRMHHQFLNGMIIEPIIGRTCEKPRFLYMLPPERLLLLPRHVQDSHNGAG